MSPILTIGYVILAIIGYYLMWRMDMARRADERISQAQRRAIAEHNRAVRTVNRQVHDRGFINQEYARVIRDMRKRYNLDEGDE